MKQASGTFVLSFLATLLVSLFASRARVPLLPRMCSSIQIRGAFGIDGFIQNPSRKNSNGLLVHNAAV